jgi:hypothetical protein
MIPAVAADTTATLQNKPAAVTGVLDPVPQTANSSSPVGSARKVGKDRISESTEHILIAAGAIGM